MSPLINVVLLYQISEDVDAARIRYLVMRVLVWLNQIGQRGRILLLTRVQRWLSDQRVDDLQRLREVIIVVDRQEGEYLTKAK